MASPQSIPALFARYCNALQGVRRYTAAGLLLAFWASPAVPAPPSATPEMVFARLGSAEGLSQGAIMSVMQDAQGFMWFGTEDGLDRYDGHELRHVTRERGVDGTLPNNWISALLRDGTGRMWIGTDGGGLTWRDPQSGRFISPAAGRGEPLMASNSEIRALFEDREGRLWLATRNSGVQMLDPARRVVTQFRHETDNPRSLSDDSVYSITQDSLGQVWIATERGLDRLDPKSGRIEAFGSKLTGIQGTRVGAGRVLVLEADPNGMLWIGLDEGLAKLDIAAGTVTLLRHQDDTADSLPKGRVTALLEDAEQRFWVGTSAGLALLDRRTGTFIVVRHDSTDPSSLPDSNITTLFQDRSGLLWIGTKTGGVARWNPRSWSFGHHRLGAESTDSVTSFSVDSRGTLWVGSFGGGVVAIDPSSGAKTRYRHDARSEYFLHDDTVMAMAADDHGRVWLGTMGGGVDCLDTVKHITRHFTSITTDPSTLPADGIMSLFRDSRGKIWVGTYGGGIATIDPATNQVTRYAHGRRSADALAGDRATALAEDRSGLIWIGTDGGGLSVLNPVSGRFAHFVHDPEDAGSLSADTVYALHVDERGSVWVGTRGGGLDQVRGAPFGAGLRFHNISESNGLPNNTVYGIESDARGTLWVATNLGLAAVDPTDRSVRKFRRNHGLQADEFNFGAHYRSPDGMLYFGGSNGYNAFRPEQLKLNQTQPPVVLTSVLKLNRPVSMTPEVLRSLDLGYRDTVVTFQFAALDFTGPAENRYAYRLEGFDADWVNSGNARQATYTHLDGGNYVFSVRAANNDGIWNEAPLSLRLHVSPPPWATWWAKSGYAAGALLLIFCIWMSQHRKVLREVAYARRLRHEVEERTAELAERNRDMECANRQLRDASVSDSLTGLGNRRRLHEMMADGSKAAGGIAQSEHVLMVVDLDHLKPINDQHGHEGGDAVLVQIADILRRQFRSDDLIVRWGGDEFVVLVTGADLDSAAALAETVRAAVSKRIFRVGEGRTARTSCSIGFACLPFVPGYPQLLDWQQVLSIADLALYQAKRDRNSWVGWGGTVQAAQVPSIMAALANPAQLERDGMLRVERRPFVPQETVDQLRTPRASGPA